jgi:hypothetical protein
MDYEHVWPNMKIKIEETCEKGKGANEYIVLTKLNKVPNRIELHDDYLMRKSVMSKRWQKITKDVVIGIAKKAIEKGEFSIEDPELVREYGRTGCIVCSMLDLSDEFEYKQKRRLVYTGKRPK